MKQNILILFTKIYIYIADDIIFIKNSFAVLLLLFSEMLLVICIPASSLIQEPFQNFSWT